MEEQFDSNFCWKLRRLCSCPFIHTHGLEIATPEIPNLNGLPAPTKGFSWQRSDMAMLFASFRRTLLPSHHSAHAELSPKDIPRYDITKLKVS